MTSFPCSVRPEKFHPYEHRGLRASPYTTDNNQINCPHFYIVELVQAYGLCTKETFNGDTKILRNEKGTKMKILAEMGRNTYKRDF